MIYKKQKIFHLILLLGASPAQSVVTSEVCAGIVLISVVMLLAVVTLAVTLVTRRTEVTSTSTAPGPGPGVKQVRPRHKQTSIHPPCDVPAEAREQRHREVLRQDSRGDQEHAAFQRGLPATLRCVDQQLPIV